MTRVRPLLVALLLTAATASPALADATVFVGANTTPANRPVRGLAVGVGLLVVGFEFEFADTPDDPTAWRAVAPHRLGQHRAADADGVLRDSSRTSRGAPASIARRSAPTRTRASPSTPAAA